MRRTRRLMRLTTEFFDDDDRGSVLVVLAVVVVLIVAWLVYRVRNPLDGDKRNLLERMRDRLGKRAFGALSFALATAWAELFDKLFAMLPGERTVSRLFAYAVTLSLVAAVLSAVANVEIVD